MDGGVSRLPLVACSIEASDTVGSAAVALRESGLSAIAVVRHRMVVGLFTTDDLLSCLFPYVDELRHTAFAPDDLPRLVARARGVWSEPAAARCTPPVVVEADTSLVHAAERFVHCEPGAVAVVRDGRFVGMLSQVVFCDALHRLIAGPTPLPRDRPDVR